MSDRINIETACKRVIDSLAAHHFTPRDADGSDFQYGENRSLRFKVGTVRGEVAVQVVGHDRVREVIRILSDEQIDEALHQIDFIIANYQGEGAVS